ncbi:uromodulin-like isoform X2 [Macrobrachium nipponense]|uniref:uromodulin-like isoform X2 n=1 Tax=Macrobrachium nipponense TaxID=159736 RepID=UPI0030C8886A
MAREIFPLILLLTVANLAHCQDWENLLFTKMGEVLEKQEAALMKQEAALSQMKEMQEKLQHIEINLQELHQEMEQLKGTTTDSQVSLQRIHQETRDCLGREDLEHFRNISSADECSEGSHNCGDHEACTDKLLQFSCSCLPGFARNSSRCEDIDECAQGKDDCSPLATCRNSVGSYSCSCNPPFEGDGRACSCPSGFAQRGSNCEDVDECSVQGKAECSSQATCRNSFGSYSCSCNRDFRGNGRTCEIDCRPGKVFEGLGCVRTKQKFETFEQMNATCREAGGRLLQEFTSTSLQEVGWAFDYYGWLGVHEGKWLESGLPLQEELWMEGSRGSDPSGRRRCGVLDWDRSSASYKVGQIDCSEKGWGLCQFVFQQK